MRASCVCVCMCGTCAICELMHRKHRARNEKLCSAVHSLLPQTRKNKHNDDDDAPMFGIRDAATHSVARSHICCIKCTLDVNITQIQWHANCAFWQSICTARLHAMQSHHHVLLYHVHVCGIFACICSLLIRNNGPFGFLRDGA